MELADYIKDHKGAILQIAVGVAEGIAAYAIYHLTQEGKESLDIGTSAVASLGIGNMGMGLQRLAGHYKDARRICTFETETAKLLYNRPDAAYVLL